MQRGQDKWEWEAIQAAGSRWSIVKEVLSDMQEKEGRTRYVCYWLLVCEWESAALSFVSGAMSVVL